MRRIPYSRQSIDESDIEAVAEVLRSDWLTQGPSVKRFEEAISAYCGSKYAVAFSNASAALHVGCKALRLSNGDRFSTSNVTFAASANCGLHCGGDVEFIDIDPQTGLMDLEKLESTCFGDRPPKLVIPVHLAGNCPDMAKLHELSQKYGFRILEDASHALGARYKDAPIGNCAFSDAAVFSLHPVKMITSGEGGLLVTNDEHIADTARRFREHGVQRDPEMWHTQSDDIGAWYYEVQDLGFNYRLSDIQAALGLSQLSRLDSFVEERRNIHRRYLDALDKKYWTLVTDTPDCLSSWHLNMALLPEHTSPSEYKQIFTGLRDASLYVNQHYIPLNRHPVYKKQNTLNETPGSESWTRRAISIPCFPGLSDEAFDFSITTLNAIARKHLTL